MRGSAIEPYLTSLVDPPQAAKGSAAIMRARLVIRRLREVRRGRRYPTYLLTVLVAICAFNYLDFQAIGLILQNIKETFDVSDTDLAVLTGIAFTLFHSTLGVPTGRWADRANRVTVIAVTLALPCPGFLWGGRGISVRLR